MSSQQGAQQQQQQQQSGDGIRVAASQQGRRARSARNERRASLQKQQKADAEAHKLTQYEYSAELGWPENFRPAVAIDKGPHTEFVSTPSKAIRGGAAKEAAPVPLPTATAAPVPVSLDIDQLRKHALPSPVANAGFAQQGVPIVQRSPGNYTGGYAAANYATGAAPVTTGAGSGYGGSTFVTQTPTKYTNAAAPMASTSYLPPAGTRSEMILPLAEAAPELFGGDAAASTPHYAPANLGAAATSTTTPIAAGSTMRYNAGAGAAVGGISPAVTAGGVAGISPAMAGGGFGQFAGATSASTPMGSTSYLPPAGTRSEMILPLAEAAPELFGGNAAASTPHYAPANLEAAATSTSTPMAAGSTMRYNAGAAAAGGISPAMAGAALPAASPYRGAYAGAGLAAAVAPPTPMSTTWNAQTGAVAMTPGGQHHVTHLPPSGTSQQLTLSLADAAPELFGGDPLSSTPHYVD